MKWAVGQAVQVGRRFGRCRRQTRVGMGMRTIGRMVQVRGGSPGVLVVERGLRVVILENHIGIKQIWMRESYLFKHLSLDSTMVNRTI